MKLLLSTLIASFIALPINAQEWKFQTDDNVTRFYGSVCKTEGLEKIIDCHHVAITGLEIESNTLNFHFDSEDETSGISYIVNKQSKQDQNGESYYAVVAFYFRTSDGQISDVKPASGSCFPNATISTKSAVVCNADLLEGLSFNSVLFKDQ